jgi:serine dehydrogenase proteinase
MADNFENKLTDLVKKTGEENQADVIFYCGELSRPNDETLFDACKVKKYKKALLMLTTAGGDANIAYRIARHLQKRYECYSLYVHTYCKSAGTLIALGAHDIIMSEIAELGPLDVQIKKADELGERSSGLTMTEALGTLQSSAFNMFEEYFLDLRFKSNFQITTKSAAEISAKLTVGLFSPIYSQIDPMHLGEINRAVRIALDYGERIQTENLKDDTINQLIAGYPDHSFVIDDTEAKNLFKKVRRPSDSEAELAIHLKDIVRNTLAKNKTLAINLTHEYVTLKEEDAKGEGGNDNVQENGRGCEIIETKELPKGKTINQGNEQATADEDQTNKQTTAKRNRKKKQANPKRNQRDDVEQ